MAVWSRVSRGSSKSPVYKVHLNSTDTNTKSERQKEAQHQFCKGQGFEAQISRFIKDSYRFMCRFLDSSACMNCELVSWVSWWVASCIAVLYVLWSPKNACIQCDKKASRVTPRSPGLRERDCPRVQTSRDDDRKQREHNENTTRTQRENNEKTTRKQRNITKHHQTSQWS